MDELTLFFRITIGLLFLFSSLSKINTFSEHIVSIGKYGIIPQKYVKTFAYFGIPTELLTSLFLILGVYQKIFALISLLLLLLYTIAIIINLLRGNKDVTCGCGGILGNHKLTWMLPIRNFVLMLISLWLTLHNTVLGSLESLLYPKQAFVFNSAVLLIVFISFSFTMVITSINYLKNIHVDLKLILLEISVYNKGE